MSSDFLILQIARFGDLVQTKRLVLSTAQEGRVHLAVDRGLTQLARILYPAAEVHGLPIHGGPDEASLARCRELFRQWRSIHFKKIFNCNYSPVSAAICRQFAPEQVIGYRPSATSQAGIYRSPWARLIFRLTGERRQSPLNLVDFWAHFTSSPVSPEKVNPVARAGSRGIGVVLAGRESRRSLPLPLLARIVEIFFELLGGPRIWLLGSHSERPAARKLLHRLPPRLFDRVTDLSGKTDWPALVEAVSGLDMLITPDTGIMHLAAHLGVPVRAFFLSSAWCHETGPYGMGHLVWQAAPPCAPCLESAPCAREMDCLESFQGDSFFRSLAAAVSGKKTFQAPENLQIWRSDFDIMGGVFRIFAGQDRELSARLANRQVLRKFLHLDMEETCPPDLQSAAFAHLCQETEWMLDPRRYS